MTAPEENFDLSSADGEAASEDLYSHDAIEQAYLQALKASEEAGLLPELPSFSEFDTDEEIQAELTPPSSPVAASREQDDPESAPAIHQRYRPQQIVEALLFVGGETLSARKMASLLGQHCTEQRVRDWVDEINQRYLDQHRPYQITLGEEGYQMSLRPEYQIHRQLLFGMGPREVKLSQEALEVLSFVAYQQPVTQQQIQEIDRPNVLTSLRQLVRRELVRVERIAPGPEDTEPQTLYSTTPRFLEVFGLTDLADLPRTRNLSFK